MRCNFSDHHGADLWYYVLGQANPIDIQIADSSNVIGLKRAIMKAETVTFRDISIGNFKLWHVAFVLDHERPIAVKAKEAIQGRNSLLETQCLARFSLCNP